ncbi:MAG TPA: hypothetical protein EYP78_06070, partial [Candidatus Omnitrophica bacterium]|nr:hypothetical protein [Candidatus Omnitrophota bacterium]
MVQENFSILLAKLENFGFLKRRIKRWEGFFFLLILIVAFLLIGSFLQGFLYTILMVVFFTGILAISIVFIFLPFFKRPSYEEVALYIERKTSGARNRIINALQLGRTVSSLDTGEKLSPLVPLIVKDAVKFISTVDFTEIISKERLLFAARIATGLSILLSVFYFAFPEKVKENFLRLRRPFDTYSYLTKYTIEVTPGDYTVLEGEPLSIEAYLRGDKVPPTLKLLYRGNGMESSTYMKFNKDHFTYTFGEVWQPFTYRVQGSIVSSQWYRVDIEEKLKVTAFTFYYQHPAYTSLGHREEQNTTGAIKAPVGTKVKFRAQCNKKLSEAWLILPSGERSPLLLTAPQVVAGELTVSESGTYQLELIDTRSRKSEISSSITAVADVPPSIRIVEPGKNVEYEEGRIAPLMVSVEGYDDYGIREMSVKYRRFTPPPQRPRLLSEKRFGWDSAPRNTVEREAEDSSPQGSTLNT